MSPPPDGRETGDHSSQKGSYAATRRDGAELTQSLATAIVPWAENLRLDKVMRTVRPSRTASRWMAVDGVDVRRTTRHWLRKGGRGTRYQTRRKRVRAGRIAVLWDVSASMAQTFELYLPWLHRLAQSSDSVGVFPFGLRVEDASELLRQPYPTAVQSMAKLPELWESGTSMGEALQAFVDEYAQVWLRGRSTVLIISDGWDSGNPDDLTNALLHMRRRGAKIDWMHPLLNSPGFELKTKSLLAARPYVSQWIPGATPQDLVQAVIV